MTIVLFYILTQISVVDLKTFQSKNISPPPFLEDPSEPFLPASQQFKGSGTGTLNSDLTLNNMLFFPTDVTDVIWIIETDLL